MKNKNNKPDFTGERIDSGIDVHKKNWSVSIFSKGLHLKSFSMNPEPAEIVKYLQKNYPNASYYTVYEAGFCGYWIDRELREAGINNIIVNPADVPTNHKEKRRKSDKIDSRKLGRELSNNTLKGIYVPSKENEAIRTLSRLRIQFTKDQTRLKNRIKSLLDFSGVHIPDNNEMEHWSGKFIKYLSEIEFEYEAKKLTLEGLIENLKQVRKQLTKVIKELRRMVNADEKIKKIVGHLQSVPGVGFIIAITLYSEIMDIKRFGRYDRLVSYVGLTPDIESSGDTKTNLGLTERQNRHLRSQLVQAAWTAIRKDPALTLAYRKLKQRMIVQRAIIRIAKKLLSRIVYVWSNEKDYVCSVVS